MASTILRNISKYGYPSELLGRGAFGSVHVYRPSGVAVKEEIACDTHTMVNIIREISFLSLLKKTSSDARTYFISLLDVCLDVHHSRLYSYIVMPRAIATLNDVTIPAQPPLQLTPSDKLSITKDILFAMHYLISYGITHRDIKSSNILLFDEGDSSPRAKLIDFGSARLVKEDTLLRESFEFTGKVTTLWYRAPEVLFKRPIEPVHGHHYLDLWSAGCIIYELYTFTHLISGSDRKECEKMLAEIPGMEMYIEGPVFVGPNKIDLMLDIDIRENIVKKLLCPVPKDRAQPSALLRDFFHVDIPTPTPLDLSDTITKHNRTQPQYIMILESWLIEVFDVYKGRSDRTLFLAFSILERYLSTLSVITDTSLQLSGVAALLIAWCLNEVSVIEMSNVTSVLLSKYTSQDIFEVIACIIIKLDGDMLRTTSYDYLDISTSTYTHSTNLENKYINDIHRMLYLMRPLSMSPQTLALLVTKIHGMENVEDIRAELLHHQFIYVPVLLMNREKWLSPSSLEKINKWYK